MNKIKEHGDIKNVMLDLTTCPGGNLAAMFRVLGFITNQDITKEHSISPIGEQIN